MARPALVQPGCGRASFAIPMPLSMERSCLAFRRLCRSASGLVPGLRGRSRLAPGVIWVVSYFQVGIEAVIPVNSDSGTGMGFLGQVYLHLDDIFPKSDGQPLIGGSTSTQPRILSFNRSSPCERDCSSCHSCYLV